jgi:hypothetical protein
MLPVVRRFILAALVIAAAVALAIVLTGIYLGHPYIYDPL